MTTSKAEDSQPTRAPLARIQRSAIRARLFQYGHATPGFAGAQLGAAPSKAKTWKAEIPEIAAAPRLEELAMSTRQFVTFLGGTAEVEFQNDPKRKAPPTSRPPLTFALRARDRGYRSI
jgi:hypothetical protein